MTKATQTISIFLPALLSSIVVGVLNISLFKFIPDIEIGDYKLNDVVFYTSCFVTTIFACISVYKWSDSSLFMYFVHFSICITIAALLVFALNIFIDELIIRNILSKNQSSEIIHIKIPFFIYPIGVFIGFLKPVILPWKKI